VQHSQAFSTSQCFNSPRNRHGLVSCRWHSWGCPFRAFPLLKSVAPSDARSPLDVSKRFQSPDLQQAARHAPFPARPPPGGYPSSKSVLTAVDVNPFTAAVTLLGLLLFKGLPRRMMVRPSPALLSRTFTPARLPCKQVRLAFARYPRVSLTCRVACLSCIPKNTFETAVLLEVHSLVTLHSFLKLPSPSLIISRHVPECVTASCRTFFRGHLLLPE
jgi:hypothetical protein